MLFGDIVQGACGLFLTCHADCAESCPGAWFLHRGHGSTHRLRLTAMQSMPTLCEWSRLAICSPSAWFSWPLAATRPSRLRRNMPREARPAALVMPNCPSAGALAEAACGGGGLQPGPAARRRSDGALRPYGGMGRDRLRAVFVDPSLCDSGHGSSRLALMGGMPEEPVGSSALSLLL